MIESDHDQSLTRGVCQMLFIGFARHIDIDAAFDERAGDCSAHMFVEVKRCHG